MAEQWLTPQQISDTLYDQISLAISPELLEEYGIQAAEEKCRYLTEEVLSLNLFWVQLAMDAHLTEMARDIIYERFTHRIKENWSADFHLDPYKQDQFFSDVTQRHDEYKLITEAGGEPIALFSDRAATMESDGVVTGGEKIQLVALLIDSVPVDSCGELLEDVNILEG